MITFIKQLFRHQERIEKLENNLSLMERRMRNNLEDSKKVEDRYLLKIRKLEKHFTDLRVFLAKSLDDSKD